MRNQFPEKLVSNVAIGKSHDLVETGETSGEEILVRDGKTSYGAPLAELDNILEN